MTTPQPYDDRDGSIWMDGKLIPWREAKVHVINQGLHYASSVFEGQRAYGGKIFKLEEHTDRLFQSAELLGFEIPFTRQQINAANLEVIAANNIVDGYIRPVAWRGSKVMGIAGRGNQIHVAIAAWPWPSYFSDEIKARGLRMKTAIWKRPSPETAPYKSKAAGLYMICTLSKHDAEDNGFEDAMMLDWRGYVAEATGANMFFVFGDELHTPTPDCFLDGITRRTVMELARNRGIKVVERHIKPEEIKDAKEVFLCGTAAEVTPVGQIDSLKFAVGPITKALAQDFDALVRGNYSAEAEKIMREDRDVLKKLAE